MIKKTMIALCMALTAAMAVGCASVKVAEDFNGQTISANGSNVAHVYGTNWGLYCFSIPLITGSVEKPGSAVLGQDTVNPKSVVRMVTRKSGDLGASKTLDLDTKGRSTWIFPLLVVFLEEYQVSGNAVK